MKKVRFYGAYCIKKKATAKARKVKGRVRAITVNGKRRYSVIKKG